MLKCNKQSLIAVFVLTLDLTTLYDTINLWSLFKAITVNPARQPSVERFSNFRTFKIKQFKSKYGVYLNLRSECLPQFAVKQKYI